ncbi:MAG: accessory factor UbiK family protein [Coxiellaceae bacterium]|nr:MAG: accessory factor UbiK family protein [Coxiellaceae bacterium]
MISKQKIDDLVQQLLAAMPSGMRDIKEELAKNFHAILQTTFSKLDLVSREEFDLQVGVLKRTREKLDMLEQKLVAIETNNAS